MKSKSLKLSIIFSSLFLSLFFSLNQALAVNDCAWDPEKSWQGECSISCDENEIEDTAASAKNCDNMPSDVCCIPNPDYDPGSELTGYCTNGNESGACVSGMGAMFSSCPEGYHSIENAEGCSMGVDCCASGEGNPGNPGDGTTPPIIDENTFAEFGLPDPGKDGGNGVQKILVGLLNWLLIVFLIISLIAFVLTGLMYLFAVGNSRSDWVDKAKKYFVDALIAVFVTGSALIIINVVNDFLNGNL